MKLLVRTWLVVAVVAGLAAGGDPQPAGVEQLARDLTSADGGTRRRAAYALWQLEDAASAAIPAVAAAVRDEDEYVRDVARRVLERFQWDKAGDALHAAVPALGEALGDKRVEVRRCAAQLLWRAGPLRAELVGLVLDLLVAALADADPVLRANAAAVLVNQGWRARKAMPALVEAVADDDRDVRLWVVQAIGSVAPEGAVDALVRALADTDPAVRAAAALSLGGAGTAGGPAGKPLLVRLSDENGEVRVAAANALWGLALRETLPALLGVAKDPDGQVAAAAVHAIGVIGEPSGLDAILAAMKDERAEVRAAANYALGGMDAVADRALPVLLEALGSGEAAVRSNAAGAIGRLGPAGATAASALRRALTDEDPLVRSTAASSLAFVGGAEEPKSLAQALSDTSPEVRMYAAWALGRLGPAARTALPALGEVYSRFSEDSTRSAVLLALGHIGGEDAALAQRIREQLPTFEGMTRAQAAFAVASLHPDETARAQAVTILVSLLDDELAGSHALYLLGCLGDRARPALAAIQHRLGDERCRIAAAGALARVHPEEAAAAIEILAADVRAGGLGAVSALGDLGPAAKPAVPALVEALREENPRLRRTSAEALGRIGGQSKTVMSALKHVADADEDSLARRDARIALRRLASD